MREPVIGKDTKTIAINPSEKVSGSLKQTAGFAVVNVFLPCELLHAMGVAPQFTEGLACYLNGAKSESSFIGYAEENGVPQTYCSYHKVLLGAALSGMLPAPRFIANTTLACDAKRLSPRVDMAYAGEILVF